MLNRQQALNLPVNLCDALLKICACLLLFSYECGNLMWTRVEVVRNLNLGRVLFDKHTAIAALRIPLPSIPGQQLKLTIAVIVCFPEHEPCDLYLHARS